ncbi:tripartite tricarboxylate transporter TctB family protein [Microbacterium oleivorans]|uniref:tripartite tricarboxylate transporter TctB family protein n=1 Tax=Microbacterium oleivorans TaxID=273677 RepID=UPI00203BD6C9|nr:tripartite tricarboxylate transporter TctB family protein [Microbacterium oleivorans]MCM3695327.1 tripartite tricarboxylate transporter TctB family protein [Microbacterium oleivorans]
MFAGIGAAFAVSSFAYDIGTPLAMGPAAFPLGVAVLLIMLGVAVIVRAVVAPSREETFVEEPATEEQLAEDSTLDKLAAAKASQAEGVPFVTRPVPVVGDVEQGPPLGFGRIPWRPLLIVTATILFFTICVEGLGLVLTSFIAVVGVSFARVETTWKQALLTGVVMAALSWVVFILLLRLNVDAIGPWIGG